MSDDDNIVPIKTGRPPDPGRPSYLGGKRPKTGKGVGNKPARGEPASGLPAMGAGWGGPAKGEGSKTPIAQHPQQFQKLTPEERQQKRQTAAEIAEEMLQIQLKVARDENQPGFVRASIADKVQDRLLGKAVSRSINASVDDASRLSDDELRAELDRTTAAIAKAGA